MEQSYIKEDETRLKAWAATKSAGKDAVSSKQFEVFKKKISEACPKPNESLLKLRKEKPKSYHKRIIKFDDHLVKLAQQSKLDPSLLVDMKAPPRLVRTSLYDGFTKEEKGRYQYLNQRHRVIPEDKFQFPVLSSWDYGWRLSDVIQKDDIKKPEYGRTRIVADTFYTRTGIPDLRKASVLY